MGWSGLFLACLKQYQADNKSIVNDSGIIQGRFSF